MAGQRDAVKGDSAPGPMRRAWSFSAGRDGPPPPDMVKRSVSGAPHSARYGFEFCDCGKTLFEQDNSALGEMPRKFRQRAWSTSCGSPLSAKSDPQFLAHLDTNFSLDGGHRNSLSHRPSMDVDIEDVVAEPPSDVSDLTEVAPKLLVTPKPELDHGGLSFEEDLEDLDQTESKLPGFHSGTAVPVKRFCDHCLRPDCLTVRPTVGYYTMEQIQKHCQADDCWIIAHGLVYDVTRYLRKHPGGPMSILSRVGGVDASADYDFHTKYSKNRLWTKYKIGKVAVCTNPPTKKHMHSTGGRAQNSGGQEEGCSIS